MYVCDNCIVLCGLYEIKNVKKTIFLTHSNIHFSNTYKSIFNDHFLWNLFEFHTLLKKISLNYISYL